MSIYHPSELELWPNSIPIPISKEDEKIEQLEKKIQDLLFYIDMIDKNNQMFYQCGCRLHAILSAQKSNNIDETINNEYYNIEDAIKKWEDAIKKWEETANIKRVNE